MKVDQYDHPVLHSLPLPQNPPQESDKKIKKLKRAASYGTPSPKRQKETPTIIVQDAEGRIIQGKMRHNWGVEDYFGDITTHYVELEGRYAYTIQENTLFPEKKKKLTLFSGAYYNSETETNDEGIFLIKEDQYSTITKLGPLDPAGKDFRYFKSKVDESGIRKTGIFNQNKLKWGLLEHPQKCNMVGSFDSEERLVDGIWNYSFQEIYGFKLTGIFTYGTEDNRPAITFQGEKLHRHSKYAENGLFKIEEQFLVYCRSVPVPIDPIEALTQEVRLDSETNDQREGQFYDNGNLKSGKIIYKTNRTYEGEFNLSERLIFGKRYYPTRSGDRFLEGSYSYIKEGTPVKTICIAEGTQKFTDHSDVTIHMDGIFRDTLIIAGRQQYPDGTIAEGLFEDGGRVLLSLPGKAPISCFYQDGSLYPAILEGDAKPTDTIFKISK